MAGIKARQHSIFKIGTNKLKANNWDLHITKREAIKLEEKIDPFEGQEFRLIAKILKEDIEKMDFSLYICSIVLDNKSHFSRLTSKKGIKINGITYKRFVGTTGGLKNNTLLFVNEDVLDELNKRCECDRNKEIKLVPAKYEAYKALTCSASQEIISPNKILVVNDCYTKFKDNIIRLDNSQANEKSRLKKLKKDHEQLKDSPTSEYIENVDLENNVSDGFSICTIEYMKKVSESLGLDYVTNGVCLRNAWFKGMLYAFPIIEFIEKYNNGNYMIKDVWGEMRDIREYELITTPSSFKLQNAYNSAEEYMAAYKRNGYEFAVTKISPNKLDNYRELNYQYLQSYELDHEDIVEITEPTIDFLKKSMCGNYEDTLNFIGVNEHTDDGTWQKALSINEQMLDDPYIIDSVHKLIKKKINNAKIGKLIVHGNYQIASGDPFALMQSICGLEVTGLLKANECYSKYWSDENVDEVVVLRSPMSIHNNIRKCKVVDNEEVRYWYQYMSTIMIINSWDTFCMAENGCDYDSDILFSTNNPVMLRKHRVLPAVQCTQSNAEKIIVTEEEVKKTNKNGMGNKVGVITNRITAMMEVQSRFPKGSKEYKELEYRISCGQLYQQDEIDRLKGIVATPMPSYWYSYNACIGMENEDFLKSICVDKKPYFMIYVYQDYKRKYKTYISNCNKKCIRKFGCSLEELENKENKTEEEQDMLMWFEKKKPFGTSKCAMNRICHYVEEQFDGYKLELKHSSAFDYKFLKTNKRCYETHREELKQLCDEYVLAIRTYKINKIKKDSDQFTILIDDKKDGINSRENLKKYYRELAKEICPNDEERLNIVLDMCYQYKNNRQFCWDVIGDLICKRLEELNGTVEK